MPPPKTAASTRLRRLANTDEADRRAKKATGLSSARTAHSIIATHDVLIALARNDDTGSAAALVPLMIDRLLTPFLSFASKAYGMAERVLEETPKERFTLRDTVVAGRGQDHARGESEARVMLMERVGDELRRKLEGVGNAGVAEEMVQGWVEEGWFAEATVKEWLGEIVDEMGGEGW